jgi:putative membrane protein
MQGFVPALVVREILVRTSPLRPGRWLAVLGTGVVLSLSAIYEFVEWWAALLLGQGADAFLGMQGDPWDTQWDMFLCLVGAILALLLLGRVHDRQLARVPRAAGEERRAA